MMRQQISVNSRLLTVLSWYDEAVRIPGFTLSDESEKTPVPVEQRESVAVVSRNGFCKHVRRKRFAVTYIAFNVRTYLRTDHIVQHAHDFIGRDYRQGRFT